MSADDNNLTPDNMPLENNSNEGYEAIYSAVYNFYNSLPQPVDPKIISDIFNNISLFINHIDIKIQSLDDFIQITQIEEILTRYNQNSKSLSIDLLVNYLKNIDHEKLISKKKQNTLKKE